GHVLHRVADHEVVAERPELVGLRIEAGEGVQRVHVAGEPDRERHRLLVVGPGRTGCPEDRACHRHRGEQGQGDERGSTVPPVTGPPPAAQEPHEHVAHGVRRADPYPWMRRLDAGVLAHLTAERNWYDAVTGHLSPLVRTLRAEMTGRVPATDSSISWPQHAYSYYTVLPEGREYAQLLRRRHDAPVDSAPELMLDANLLAGESGYVDLGLWKVSPDASMLAYSVDLTGDEIYELRFRELSSGAELTDVVPRSAYGGAWSADSTYFFYTVHDPMWRQDQVWRHRRGPPVPGDQLVVEDPDEKFELMVRATRSGDQVVIWSESRDTSEVWVVPASAPTLPARSVGGRRPGVEYHPEHVVLPDGSSRLLVVTNAGAEEF